MKKLLVTAAGPHMAPVLNNISLPAFTTFALQHGYDVCVNRIAEDDTDRQSIKTKEVRWQKIDFIRKALASSDVVVWFDADVLIRRTDTDIFDSLDKSDYQGLVLQTVSLENRTNPNTGVWVMRHTEKAFRFLDRVSEIGMQEGRWSDQGAVLRALEWHLGDARYHGACMPDVPTEFITGTAWLPIGWNQPYLAKYAGPRAEPKPFALHFMGMSALDRLQHMRAVAESRNT